MARSVGAVAHVLCLYRLLVEFRLDSQCQQAAVESQVIIPAADTLTIE